MTTIPERQPLWTWIVSWGFWILVSGVAALCVHYGVESHKEATAAERHQWRLRYDLCKRLSRSPRPSWQECLARANEGAGDLLARGSKSFDGR